MKLNPPGSSSDLEVARAIARRLHRRARGGDAAADAVEAPESSPSRPPAPSIVPSLEPEPPEPQAPPPPLEPEPPELEVPSVLEPEPPELEVPPALEPEPPELEVPPALEPEPPELSGPETAEPPKAYEADTDAFGPGSAPPPPVEEATVEPEPPGGYSIDAGEYEQALPGGPGAPEPSWGGEEVAADAVGGNVDLDGLAAPGAPGAPEVSPEDLLSDQPPAEPSWSEPSPLEAEVGPTGGEAAAEDVVEATEQTWDDIADSCLALAPANGAMLVDPAGQVLTARGDWPEPGPEAIAGRLVSMMEKKLRDAPTRSVSAPLAGQHLTAWRVPADEGYLTVVFMAETPLRADVRPAIDTTIQAAGG
jgi:hypothetical protein